MASGMCKLTGMTGSFVKCHIFPKSLTYKSDASSYFIQGGNDLRPIRRWDSWYDPILVTREGEDILQRHDSFAIEELKKHKLVWSSWGPMRSLSTSDHIRVAGSHFGIRKITGIDSIALRLFFLSILWRAAASGMSEFRDIDLSHSQMRRLRRMVKDSSPYPLEDFPVMLTQISTIGPIHNHTPTVERKVVSVERKSGKMVPIFRFYMDGLVAHLHSERSSLDVTKLGSLIVGGERGEIGLSTVTYEGSRQKRYVETIVPTSYVHFMGMIRKPTL